MNDYFVKQSLIICLWFFCIAGLLRIEVSWLSENITTLILFILITLGSVILGYSNTHFAPEPKVKMSLILHTRANSNMRCDSFKSHMIINKLSKFL